MKLVYLGGGLVVLAQFLGIYGLVTRKADFVLSLVVGTVFIIGVLIGGYGVYHQLS